MMFKRIVIPAKILLLMLFCTLPVKAQFIHFSMEVETELSVRVVQDLNFGSFISNSGVQRVQAESPDVGIFEIRTFGSQNVLVTLNLPDNLRNGNTQIDDKIPVSLLASYAINDTPDILDSKSFNKNLAWIPMGRQNPKGTREGAQWETAYIFIYGSINIGEVEPGDYSSALVLSVEYQ